MSLLKDIVDWLSAKDLEPGESVVDKFQVFGKTIFHVKYGFEKTQDEETKTIKISLGDVKE